MSAVLSYEGDALKSRSPVRIGDAKPIPLFPGQWRVSSDCRPRWPFEGAGRCALHARSPLWKALRQFPEQQSTFTQPRHGPLPQPDHEASECIISVPSYRYPRPL